MSARRGGKLLLIVLWHVTDPLSILVVVVPILFTAVTALGYDPVRGRAG